MSEQMLGAPEHHLPRAVVAGGLLFSPADAHLVDAVSHLCELGNPKHRAWQRHQKGPEPSKTISAIQAITDGPWTGGRVAPLHGPLSILHHTDKSTEPEAEAVQLADGLQLRAHQQAALEAWLRVRHGVVTIPCGGGKTVVGLAAIAAASTPALVLVHTKDLAEQWRSRCLSQAGVDAGRWYGGKRELDRRVVIASVQTLVRMSWWERFEATRRFGLVILDEAHHAPASTFQEVIGSIPARNRLALTATPRRPDGLTPLLYWSFGCEVYRVEQSTLEAAGHIVPPTIHIHNTGWTPPEDAVEPHEREAAMAEDEDRNDQIIGHATSLLCQKRRLLILARRVEHCRHLADRLQRDGWRARPLIGEMKSAEREEVLAGLRTGDVQVAVATTVADEGLDVPELDAVILAAPSRNPGTVQQRIGRACRPGGKTPIIIDLVDDYGPYLSAARVRRQMYIEKGWAA